MIEAPAALRTACLASPNRTPALRAAIERIPSEDRGKRYAANVNTFGGIGIDNPLELIPSYGVTGEWVWADRLRPPAMATPLGIHNSGGSFDFGVRWAICQPPVVASKVAAFHP